MAPAIRFLDGRRLRRAIVAGAGRVIRSRESLDRINVFPVADGDTGTNMAATLQAVVDAAEELDERDVGRAAETLADAALLGARGNSGAILAQLFEGFAEGSRGRSRLDVAAFSAALDCATRRAVEAVARPRDGTILSVLRDCNAEVARVAARTGDFVPLLERALDVARESLARTPELLAVLREAKVVDAGAQGLVELVDGIVELVRDGMLESGEASPPGAPATVHVVPDTDAIGYRYCTECLVVGSAIDLGRVREAVSSIGDSAIVAGSPRKVRIHVHTDHPRDLVDRAWAFGDVQQQKVDDIHEQHIDTFGDVPRRVAIVSDSTCDLPLEVIRRHALHVIPVRVSLAGRDFIDKVTITRENFARTLAASQEHPKTSTPPAGDFRRAYEWLTKHYDAVVSIHLAGRMTSTVQLAASVAARVSPRVRVIDGRSASVGLGLLALEAARGVREGEDFDAVVRRVEAAIARLSVVFSVASTEFLIRGGRIGFLKGALTRVMRAKPILAFDPEGALEPVGVAVGGRDPARKALDWIERRAEGKRGLRFAVAHAEAPNVAALYAAEIRRRFGVSEVIETEISPALSCHTGPGSAGIALLHD